MNVLITILILMLGAGLYLAIWIFAVIAGGGLGAIFLYHIIKEYRDGVHYGE
jgi:hypothetical protein